MIKIFLDSSVIIAGIASDKGASHFILELSKEKKIKAYISSTIIKEVIRNLQKKFPQLYLKQFILRLPKSNFIKVSFKKESDLLVYKGIVDNKDIHVIVGAVKAKVDYLITLDQKHLLKIKNKKFPFQIISPGDFLIKLLK